MILMPYIAKRIAYLIPVLLLTSLLAFSLIRVIPGDPAELILEAQLQSAPTPEQIKAFNTENGLDKPLFVQYGAWLKKAIRWDFGQSLKSGVDIGREYSERFWATLKLFICGQLLALFIAVPLGVWSALKPDSLIDRLSRVISLGGISFPGFWIGMLLVYIFAIKLHWLPAFGYERPVHIILPALTLGISGAMELTRLTRTSILEVLRLNYVRTARAKGLTERSVITGHVLRNALIPIATAVGMHFHHMASGTVIIEMLFAWPGLGRMLLEAANARDIPVIQSFVFISSIIFVLINLLIDLIYMALDPRIDYQLKKGI
jgi:peptide/nickel transport system permease protein